MKRIILITISLLFAYCLRSQITIIGHNMINNERLYNTLIKVRDGDNVLQNVNTKNSSDFKIKLNFGKIYRIYFHNKESPLMFMEVVANNVPVEKQNINMIHELNLDYYYWNDEDIDTLVFSKPCRKIIFDGNTKMIEDTAYRTAFEKRIIKTGKVQEAIVDPKAPELPVIIAGRVLLNNDIKMPLTYKTVQLIDKKGQVLKTTKSNRFGSFAFTGVKFSEIGKLKINSKDNDINGGAAYIVNSTAKPVANTKCLTGNCDINLSTEQAKLLIDNNFVSNIGGKLIHNIGNQKKFYANKTVYLSNKRNTVIKKTKTNMLGTFVFEDIKPDNTYFIGIDAKEVAAADRIDFVNKDDKFVSILDTLAAARRSIKINSDYNERYNDISISEDEMKMNVNAKLYGDNTNNPIGKLKILLLNDNYQVIDSAITDDFGAFKFKYLPFLKRFYLSAENSNNILDVFNNILVYSNEDNLLKIMTHEKGSKFNYKPMPIELSRMKDIEVEDPWLDLLGDNRKSEFPSNGTRSITNKKTIVENIFFESNKFDLLPQAKQILDKVILVLNTNKKVKIELSAHTDSKGNDTDNLKLSQLRAKTVREYITLSGIEEARIISVGYGETRLLNNCGNTSSCSEIEHARNRRVEFKILEE